MVYIKKLPHSSYTVSETLWQQRMSEAEHYGMKEVEHNKKISIRDEQKIQKAHKEMKQIIRWKDSRNTRLFEQAKELYKNRFGQKALEKKLYQYYHPNKENI